jgi:hypothetical protein
VSKTTYHSETQKLSGEEIIVALLQVVKVVLKPGVGIRVAVGKLIHLILVVKVERKGHHIVLSVIRATVVVHILGWYAHPNKQKRKQIVNDNTVYI